MEKQKSTGKTVIIIVLLLALIASCGYIGYDMFLKEEGNTTTSEENKEPNQEEQTKELELNNRLVQNLYREVGSGDEYGIYWMYNDIENQDKIDIQSMPEINKMELVFVNIRQTDIDGVSCYNVPEMPDVGQCFENQGTEMIAREVVEETYRKLYGSTASLDLNTIMYTDSNGVGRYVYIESLDAYVLYTIQAGGSSAATYQRQLTRAEQIGNQIKLYETLTISSLYDETQQPTTENYIYTFEMDTDGMYNYITREKA